MSVISKYANTKLNIAAECLTRHAQSALRDKTAMVFVRSDLSHSDLTYGELDELSARFATSLAQRGLKKGDRILLRLPNTQVFPIAFFGALRGGFIPVPTSPMLTATEFNYLLQDAGAAAIVSEATLYAPLRGNLHPGVNTIYISGETQAEEIGWKKEIENCTPAAEMHDSVGCDAAYLVYTSGTTGYPKGVLHAHQALFGRLPAATEWFTFSADSNDRILHSGKFNWTYVLGTAMMDPLYHGKTVVVYEGASSPERWVELIRLFACNIFIGVPTIFRQILQKTAADRESVPGLTHAMCAGEHLTDEVLGQWIARFGFPIYEGLGMSECSYYISQRKADTMKPNSAGKIQTGRPIAVLDENLQPVTAGHEGMLCIRRDDPGLFLEYWKSESSQGGKDAARANTQQFQGDWFLTGDYARVDEDGFVFFLGRRDEIIKSFGYRISPFEIERVYRDYAELEDVVAFAENAGPEKTLIAMCVILKPGFTFDAEQIIAWGKEKLASYKVPKKVYALSAFPRSANGKVLRSKIPAQVLQKPA